MGEWSKRIGDTGEDVVQTLLKNVGWSNLQVNFDVPCVRPAKHGVKSIRKTHGIDRMFTYKDQLEDELLTNVIISVKYSTQEYPDSPDRTFKKYAQDLVSTVECFNRSQRRSEILQRFNGVSKARTIAVLFWLTETSNPDNEENFIERVARWRPSRDIEFDQLYLVNNSTARFLHDTMTKVRAISRGGTVDHFYCNTGRNFNQTGRSSHGSIMPVEFLNSPVQLLVIGHENAQKTFVVSCQLEFNTDRLCRLIGLAKDIGQNLQSKTIVLFPNYSKLRHSDDVAQAKSSFYDQTFVEQVEVDSLAGDFRTQNDG